MGHEERKNIESFEEAYIKKRKSEDEFVPWEVYVAASKMLIEETEAKLNDTTISEKEKRFYEEELRRSKIEYEVALKKIVENMRKINEEDYLWNISNHKELNSSEWKKEVDKKLRDIKYYEEELIGDPEDGRLKERVYKLAKLKMELEVAQEKYKIAIEKEERKSLRKKLGKAIKIPTKKIVATVLAVVAAIGSAFGITSIANTNAKEEKGKDAKTITDIVDLEESEQESNIGDSTEERSFSDQMKALADLEDDQKDIKKETKKDTIIDINNWQEVLTDFKLGTTVELDDGIKYSENSQGQGKQGKIGTVPWRQAGEYEINGVAILNDENEIVSYKYDEPDLSINEFASGMSKNEKLVFHIAQVDGNKTNDTGWVKSDVVLKKLMEKNKEKNNVEKKSHYRMWNDNRDR